MNLKIVTFNIRCDYDQDGNNSFRYRKPFILEKLNTEKPDIICFQEVRPHVVKWLKDELTEYYVVGCGTDKTLSLEYLAVAFRKEIYSLARMETFWLSPTPNVPGSRYEDQSDCPRVCTELLLVHEEERKVIRIANLHLDHIGSGARVQGLKQIANRIEKEEFYKDVPTIILGDFNMEQDGKELKTMNEYPEYTNITKGIGITYHGFGIEAPESIDNIFVTSQFQAEKVEKWEDCHNGVWLSDHYPICGYLTLN